MQFSINTHKYLDAYYEILSEMQSQMTSVKFDSSISENFIKQMLPHHRAAIKMSEELLKYTENISLQNIALNIISEQTQSIENMESVEAICSRTEDNASNLNKYRRKNTDILNNMFTNMRKARACNSIDISFMHQMIPHHLGAIGMAENTLCFEICSELVPILDSIITSQKKGVCQMRELLSALT